MRNATTIFFLIIVLTGCMKDDPLNLSFESYAPKDIGDGHILSCPANEKIDSLLLFDIYNDANADDNLWSIRSLLVFRHGKLVAENYFKDQDDITSRHLIWSCTKQVLGALTGIAIEDGVITSIDDPISDYFTSELSGHDDKANISIQELITMKSGIGYSNDGTKGQTDKLLRQIPDNMVDYILSLPMETQPGSSFHYKDGDPHLLSAIIQKTTGKPTDVWADEVLFSRIGFRNYNWVRYKDGITHGGYGIETTPRELAKIALCVADSGRWNGDQIISPDWIIEMTTPKATETNYEYVMGYYWWIDTANSIYFMNGHGGQYAFVVPSKELVVVMTAIPNTQGDYQIEADQALEVVYRIMNISY